MNRRGQLRLCVGLLVVLATAVALAGCGETSESRESTGASDTGVVVTTEAETRKTETKRLKTYVVARVIDGDTIELKNGQRVRLVQVDAPESQDDECFGSDSSEILSAILPRGTKVTLEADPKLDDVDRYERLLRYVFKGKKNVNLVVVQRGSASVWFFEGDRGQYAKQLLRAAKKAKAGARGLWGSCAGATLDPLRAVETGTSSVEASTPPETSEPEAPEAATEEAPASNCHPSYTGACLDPSASDYDCEGGEGNGPLYTGTVTVVGYDEYGLDGDGDGVGCE